MGTVEARNLRFGMQNGAEGGLKDISETVEARNFKFGTQIGH